MKKLYKAIKRKLIAVRKAQKWSYADMAQILGMTRGAVSLMEKSDGRVLIEHLYNVAYAAGIAPRTLLP